jgi:hypothetical protein
MYLFLHARAIVTLEKRKIKREFGVNTEKQKQNRKGTTQISLGQS